MTIFDYAVLGVLLASVLLSVFRGAVRELLSLAGWVVAFMAARSLSVDLAPMIPPSIEDESLRMSVAFVAIFLTVLVAMGLIAMLLSALIKTVGLGFIDRMLGSVFGLARGLLIVLLVVLLAGMTTLPQEPLWQKAVLSKTLERAVELTLPWLPQELSKRIHYEKKR
ncbi:MAG: CvpA family protein [Nitrosomonadaceae bacterium]|jgi:membrane protein required for colicin V production